LSCPRPPPKQPPDSAGVVAPSSAALGRPGDPHRCEPLSLRMVSASGGKIDAAIQRCRRLAAEVQRLTRRPAGCGAICGRWVTMTNRLGHSEPRSAAHSPIHGHRHWPNSRWPVALRRPAVLTDWHGYCFRLGTLPPVGCPGDLPIRATLCTPVFSRGIARSWRCGAALSGQLPQRADREPPCCAQCGRRMAVRAHWSVIRCAPQKRRVDGLDTAYRSATDQIRRAAAVAALIRRCGQAGWQRWIASLRRMEMVGGTGLEPVTPAV